MGERKRRYLYFLVDASETERTRHSQHFETHDRKTGEVIRINPDDDTMTLGEMLRQERMGAGMADQKDMDAQFARAVMGDGKFEVSRLFIFLAR